MGSGDKGTGFGVPGPSELMGKSFQYWLRGIVFT